MDITTGQLICAGIVGILVQYLIITYAVHNATEVIRRQSKIQSALLAEMARKAGVAEQDIENALAITK